MATFDVSVRVCDEDDDVCGSEGSSKIINHCSRIYICVICADYIRITYYTIRRACVHASK